jgi:P-type E1-E2 ATPase
MKASGLRVVMLTGDSLEVAKQVCQTVGVATNDCHARLLPKGKLEWVQMAEGRKERVCMVGDGINDASALAGMCIFIMFILIIHVRVLLLTN